MYTIYVYRLYFRCKQRWILLLRGDTSIRKNTRNTNTADSQTVKNQQRKEKVIGETVIINGAIQVI